MHTLKAFVIPTAAFLVILGIFYHAEGRFPDKEENTGHEVLQSDQLGKRVYTRNCLTCHQKDGSGVSSMYPPVIDNPRVKGDKAGLIKIILEGQRGPIEVHGEHYNGVMPPFRSLSDKEVASVLTYMRQNFKNDTTAVSVEKVKEVRDSLKSN